MDTIMPGDRVLLIRDHLLGGFTGTYKGYELVELDYDHKLEVASMSQMKKRQRPVDDHRV